MTQTNNEREVFELSISMEYEHPTDLTRDGDGYSDGYVDNAWWGWCKALHYSKSPISQNEQHEAVGVLNSTWGSDTGWQYNIKLLPSFETDKYLESIDGHDIYLYLSPHKQAIPEGWKPIETAPNDGTQVIIKCSGGRVATAFYDDKPFVGEGWHVVVPFLGGFGSGTDTFIFYPEDMPTHWMPLPPAPTTSLTSETNTEVGE